MIRLTGAALIIISAAYIGFYRADILKKRLMYLNNIKTSLNILESEIAFSRNVLPRVFARINDISDTNGLFLKAAENIGDMGIKKAWAAAVDDTYSDMFLKERDKETLYIFGEGLGMSDRDNQMKNIRHTADMLNSLIAEAEEEYKRNGRLYRSAGILTGLFFAVLLY